MADIQRNYINFVQSCLDIKREKVIRKIEDLEILNKGAVKNFKNISIFSFLIFL
ncbi:MAG: hypothetical protein QW755_06195 [Nitrososphaerota archaeon]